VSPRAWCAIGEDSLCARSWQLSPDPRHQTTSTCNPLRIGLRHLRTVAWSASAYAAREEIRFWVVAAERLPMLLWA
jgi:hypothetical protein